MILAEPRHEPKVRQGVTTEVVGVDGNGFAPFERREDLEAFVAPRLRPRRPAGDIDYDWRSVASYLARYDGTVSVNVATLVGNSPLRIEALGWDDVPADARAIDRMRGLLRDGDGRGRVRASAPASTTRPASYATTEELAALTAEAGGPAASTTPTSATRSATATSTRSARRSRSAGAAEAPAHITHFYHRETHPGGPEPLLALVDDARAEGLDVTFDAYPSEWASTRLLIQLPPGSRPAARARSRSASPTDGARPDPRASSPRAARLRRPGAAGRTSASALPPPENLLRGRAARSADVMGETGHDAVDVICDLLLAEDLGVNQVTSGPSFRRLRPFLAPSGRDGRDRLDVRRRQAQPADLRQLPAHPRPVRARRGPAQPRGGRSAR